MGAILAAPKALRYSNLTSTLRRVPRQILVRLHYDEFPRPASEERETQTFDVYSLDTVVEGDISSPILPDALAGDRILLVVHGQSIAGIDLSQLRPEDVRIDPDRHSIHVTLPPSQLFLTTLDNQHTRVHARSTGLLVPVDQNLESNTRAKAQNQLEQAALSDGILDAARKNARATVTTLLYSPGFQQVDVT
jgi:uncharacterized protein DUF4230